MFAEIIPSLIEYSQDLDKTIKEIQLQILQMENMLNKSNTHKRPLELKYMQTKLQQTQPTLNDVNNDIEKILYTAEQFLQAPSKTQVEPKVIPEYEPPKRIKPNLDPYRNQAKKPILSRKVSQKKFIPTKYPKRTSSLIKPQQQVTPKITAPPKISQYEQHRLQRENNKSFKDNSKLSPNKLSNSQSQHSILIEDQSRSSISTKQSINQTIPNRKSTQQPYLGLQPIQQNPQQSSFHQNQQQQQQQYNQNISFQQKSITQQNQIQLQQQQFQQQQQQQQVPKQDIQLAIMKKMEFSGLKDLARLKRMKDALMNEYSSSYTYFRDKECKARGRFLTKYHQHMAERKKILQQQVFDNKQTFFLLNDQIDQQHLKYIDQQIKIEQPKTLLIMKYCDIVQASMDAIEFNDELLKLLKRTTKTNVNKLQTSDLIEIFHLWSQIQIIRQNFQQLSQQIQIIPDESNELIKWLGIKRKTESKKPLNNQIQLSKQIFKTQLVVKTQDEALEFNRLIVKQEVYKFLWETLQKLAFSKQQFEQSIMLFKTILNLFSKNNSCVYVFKVSDLIF